MPPPRRKCDAYKAFEKSVEMIAKMGTAINTKGVALYNANPIEPPAGDLPGRRVQRDRPV
jgi:hypothetical protein